MPTPPIDRRSVLAGGAAAGIAGLLPTRSLAQRQPEIPGAVISVGEFGATTTSSDNTRAIQAAIDEIARQGGGTVLIAGRYRCGKIVVSGSNLRIQGRDGWLVNGRLTIRRDAENIEVVDLGLLHTKADPSWYLMDVAGRNCRFTNVQLVKDPIAGGYQMYMRQPAAGCRFSGLRLKGSNGIMVAGRDHLFEDFQLEARMPGGDDAFAIKGLEGVTENITIRNGLVRGYAAIVSIGSEIGTQGASGGSPGAVRNVIVENVTGDRCTRVAFIKPGALIYDWRNGLVEKVWLRNLTLHDPAGERFRSGIHILAARGATIRDVRASAVSIVARARDRGVAPTAAIDITLLDKGDPATIEDVDLQVKFVDPHDGAPHGLRAPGYPVDHIVRIEKIGKRGSMSGLSFDVEGRGAGIGGVYVGGGLDGAVTLRRAILERVATNPPASRGGGGIWSNSRLNLGEVKVDSVKLPAFGGRAFPMSRD